MQISQLKLGNVSKWIVSDGEGTREIQGEPYSSITTGSKISSHDIHDHMPPLAETNKVIGIAANYGPKDERDGPGIFLKQPGTYVGHKGNIVFPKTCKSIVHEAELGVVIGKTAKHINEEDALEYVLGYTCVNDVSAKEMAESDIGKGLSMRVKHFDTFCPMGPHIETSVENPNNLTIECLVNGKVSASGNTSEMIFPVEKLLCWVSDVMTLNPGDVIATGCPGASEIWPGDRVEVKIQSIGSLENTVVSETNI